jgi:hypothetical protein
MRTQHFTPSVQIQTIESMKIREKRHKKEDQPKAGKVK